MLKTRYRSLAFWHTVAALVLALSIAGCSSSESKKSKNTISPEVAQAQGKVLYEKYCQNCHGPSMQGDGPDALLQAPADLTRKSAQLAQYGLQRIVDFPHYDHTQVDVKSSTYKKYGSSAMPALKTVLSEKQVAVLTWYINTTIESEQ